LELLPIGAHDEIETFEIQWDWRIVAVLTSQNNVIVQIIEETIWPHGKMRKWTHGWRSKSSGPAQGKCDGGDENEH
jgi:hypothetical protein